MKAIKIIRHVVDFDLKLLSIKQNGENLLTKPHLKAKGANSF
jgi:hypothetical protein